MEIVFDWCGRAGLGEKNEGAPGIEPGTSRSAVECSTTELYSLNTGYSLKLAYLNTCGRIIKMSSVTELDTLRLRIEELERLVFGQEREGRTHDRPTFYESLEGIASRLRSLEVLELSNVLSAWEHTDELQQLLTSEGSGDETLEEEKREVILLREDSVRETAKLLQELSKVKMNAQGAALKGKDAAEASLPSIVQEHVRQQCAVQEEADKVKELLTAYNNAMGVVSKMFVSLEES